MAVVEHLGGIIRSIESVGVGREIVRYIEAETGVVLDEFSKETRLKRSGRPPGGKTHRFYRVYWANWNDIVRNKRLTFQEIGVLMSLLAFVGWETAFLVHPKTGQNLSESDLAELLNTDRKRLHEVLVRLRRKGLIHVVVRGDGTANHFMLNSHVLWFGKYMRDLQEHSAFENCAYKPVSRVTYKEPPSG